MSRGVTRTLCLRDDVSGDHYLSPRGDDVWRLRPGWGWGGCTAWRAQPRIKVREQRDLPAAARQRRAAASRDADHTRKALGIRLPETRAQVNNWWRLIRPRTKLCGKPAHPIPSGFGSFCQGICECSGTYERRSGSSISGVAPALDPGLGLWRVTPGGQAVPWSGTFLRVSESTLTEAEDAGRKQDMLVLRLWSQHFLAILGFLMILL